MTALALEPGMRLGGYRLIEPLGRGGMGGVWEVEDAAGNRHALKSPAIGMTPDPELLKRFAREANALRMIEHPNLVAAVDVFVEAGGLYLVMERVEGQTLTKAIDGRPLQTRRALVIARQLLEGLGHAHANGLIHRDLKPENVMLVDMGGWERVKIVDWGLVKLIGDAEAVMGGGKLTRTGIVQGTPRYMAPEQALGRVVDGRADLYALGVILFEMLTGRVPFDHQDPVTLLRMQVKQPAPRLDVVAAGAAWCTPELVSLVGSALAKQPDERPANALAMIDALDTAFRSLDDVL